LFSIIYPSRFRRADLRDSGTLPANARMLPVRLRFLHPFDECKDVPAEDPVVVATLEDAEAASPATEGGPTRDQSPAGDT
jgi:hypothetical protein